ncbi:hypothetical protein VP1G_02259 [Cytospora mali]|uniref:Uncharacterized protein n=1 Tax=Cytospora mali TaxID=578113 RepID=A0A194USX0_CYTMA|nr:hypothetical protein VP1G_02259 [Valsa mali var. pyri (nom. inval.)]
MSHDDEHIATDPNYDAASNIGRVGYYHATDYSIPYLSAWSRIHNNPVTKNMLRHMGCSYMGTEGIPPTLLALKQHAQSLAVLIAHLSPSVKSGRVDAKAFDFDPGSVLDDGQGNKYREYIDKPERRMELNDAFDWLADLSQPYVNDDPNHHKPLNTLVNEVKGRHDVLGTEYQCPLADVPPRLRGDARQNGYIKQVSPKPYASHHNLVMHANECLERLDHEFSATGGIMSLIPAEGRGATTQELKDAQNSLLGQMLMWMQALVLRNQELEMSVGACTDALASEAVVPLQHLSMTGPDGRSGREIAYPQDRWVLVNAGDDVWNYLHDTMDRQEALIEAKEKEWQHGGLLTQRAWMQERGGYQYARGLVVVDVNTRFYRLQGQGRSTIFVLPAWEHHPALEWTKAMQEAGKQKVVSVVTPKYPERVSEFERRWNERKKASDKTASDFWQLDQKKKQLELTVSDLRRENRKHVELVKKLSEVVRANFPEEQADVILNIIEENRNLRSRANNAASRQNI